MEIHQLRYFCAVAKTGSFTRAAQLNIWLMESNFYRRVSESLSGRSGLFWLIQLQAAGPGTPHKIDHLILLTCWGTLRESLTASHLGDTKNRSGSDRITLRPRKLALMSIQARKRSPTRRSHYTCARAWF